MGRRLSGARLLRSAVAASVLGLASMGPAAVEAAARPDWSQVVRALEAGDLETAYQQGQSLLAGGSGELPLDAQQAAFRLGLALVDADAFERAAEIQLALFERVPAEWSAINASLTLSRSGRLEEADQVLARQLERTPRAAELWNQRGVLWLGAGRRDRAERHLGRAVRYGSLNASLSLGHLALLAGEFEAARAAFRPGVDGDEVHAWGLRGWAATLLPGDSR